ncbi:MAG: NAD-binding protein [Microthrixaceae bacterium]
MKSLALILTSIIQPLRRRNTRVVVWLVLGLLVLIALYSTIFHEIMDYEGRSYSWATGIYWTLTVMSTLGFGDITFESDVGRIFSVIVLISGALFILVLLPFVFIQFIFMPWMVRRDSNRTPRRLGRDVHGHVILTNMGPIAEALIRRMQALGLAYVVIVEDPGDALALSDAGYEVMVGALDDPDTYVAARAGDSALVVATRTDMTNTNIVFTVDELDSAITTVATASSAVASDVLRLAGCDTVLTLGAMLGEAMARRVLGRDARARVIGAFDELLVAEASADGTSLAGLTVGESDLRTRCQVSIAGIWHRGRFAVPGPSTVIESSDVLILVGTGEQLDAYDSEFARGSSDSRSVVIVGGGRVGRAAASALGDEGIKCRIIEKRKERILNSGLYVHGDASDVDVLNRAGMESADAMLITTHDDDVNIYLTIYCRALAPEMQIISRSNHDRNVASLNRAGADSVLSYASLGATAILNTLGDNDSLVLAEGLEMFSVPVPPYIATKTLVQSKVRELTGCNVVAITENGRSAANPDPQVPIAAGASLVIIGDSSARDRFLERFPSVPHRRIRRRP